MSKRTHQRTLFGGLQPEEVFFKGVGLYEQVLNKYMNENRNCGASRESLQKRAKAFWVELKNPLPLGDVACPISEYLREVETPAKNVHVLKCCNRNSSPQDLYMYNDFGYATDVPTAFTGFNEICEAITKST